MAKRFNRLASLLKKSSSSSKLGRSYSSESSSSSWSSCSTDVDTDYEDCNVPQGCFAVYVGAERRKFFVKTQHLNHALFKALLERSAEEYGFDQAGVLSIPCEAVFFEHVLWLLNNNDSQARSLEIQELLRFYAS